MRIAFIFLLVISCAAPVPQTAPEPKPVDDGRARLLPVDRASEDPSFVAYRDKLRAAVAARDTEALLALVDPKIRTDFGGGGGLADFRRHWNLPSKDSKLWSELDVILSHGGSFRSPMETKMFCAPYVYSEWPDNLDAFTYLAVIDDDAPLRKAAAANATVIETLRYDLVKNVGMDFGKPWREVELENGTRGFVANEHVRSPIEYRACFAQTGGQWRMNLLVAGD